MKIFQDILYFLCILILFLFFSCDKDKFELDSRKAIIGKWEITHLGNPSNLVLVENPLVYEEYKNDSIIIEYIYKEQRYDTSWYWFEDSLMIKSSGLIIDELGDSVIINIPYKYTFLTPDRLQLDMQFPAINNIAIYERID